MAYKILRDNQLHTYKFDKIDDGEYLTFIISRHFYDGLLKVVNSAEMNITV